MNLVKESSEYLKNSENVFIEYSKVESFASKLTESFMQGKILPVPVGNVEKYVQKEFVGNAINYCFWKDKPYRKYKNGNLSSSEAMWFVVESNQSLKNAEFLAMVSKKDVVSMFGEIPLLEERVVCLNDAGQGLLSKYDGKAINILRKADFNCENIIREISKNFFSWDDSSKTVSFYKRIQCFISALLRCEELADKMNGTEVLTLMADYQVPKLFHYYGLVTYQDALEYKINHEIPLKPRSKEELEIRAATIVVGDLIFQELYKAGRCRDILCLDNYLWSLGRQLPGRHHLCASIWY